MVVCDTIRSVWHLLIILKPILTLEQTCNSLESRIDGTPRLLVIPFFATLPVFIQHTLFINFGEFCHPPFLFQTPCLLIHVHSRQQ